MVGHHPAQLGRKRARRAQRQVRLVPFLQASQLQFLKPGDLGLREGLIAEIGQRRATPEQHRLVEQLDRLRGVSRGERIPSLEDELLELGGVELRREKPQQVARSRGDKAAGRQHPPQP
jgi:hypothetical protein